MTTAEAPKRPTIEAHKLRRVAAVPALVQPNSCSESTDLRTGHEMENDLAESEQGMSHISILPLSWQPHSTGFHSLHPRGWPQRSDICIPTGCPHHNPRGNRPSHRCPWTHKTQIRPSLLTTPDLAKKGDTATAIHADAVANALPARKLNQPHHRQQLRQGHKTPTSRCRRCRRRCSLGSGVHRQLIADRFPIVPCEQVPTGHRGIIPCLA